MRCLLLAIICVLPFLTGCGLVDVRAPSLEDVQAKLTAAEQSKAASDAKWKTAEDKASSYSAKLAAVDQGRKADNAKWDAEKTKIVEDHRAEIAAKVWWDGLFALIGGALIAAISFGLGIAYPLFRAPCRIVFWVAIPVAALGAISMLISPWLHQIAIGGLVLLCVSALVLIVVYGHQLLGFAIDQWKRYSGALETQAPKARAALDAESITVQQKMGIQSKVDGLIAWTNQKAEKIRKAL